MYWGRGLWGGGSGGAWGARRDGRAGGLVGGSSRDALIRWPHKWVRVPESGSRRLVDLEADPDERHDLAPAWSTGVGESRWAIARAWPS